MLQGTVVKRDGRIVPFDKSLILNAITRAQKAAYEEAYARFAGKTLDLNGVNIDERCNAVVDAVTGRLFKEHETPCFEVECIQDFVEEELMRYGSFSVARLYIKYREKHKENRAFYDSIFPADALSEYITASRYARYSPELLRRETLSEMVMRVSDMHVQQNPGAESLIRWAFDHVQQQNVLPSMRSFQFGGFPVLEKNPRIFNCIAGPVDSIDFFREYMYLLLCGCGVGYAVDYEFVEQLPPVVAELNEDNIVHHTVEDSIEGWAWAVDALIRSFVEGFVVEFNYSQIRPKGSPIRTGGRAPGHVSLRRALDHIRSILYGAMGRQLEPIEIFDINCFIADAVLAGGVRRCIAEGSRVQVKGSSFKPIEQVKVGDLVSTPDGWKPVTNIFVQGKQQTVRVKHENGELVCTPNHRVAVLTDVQGNFEWKRADELLADDRLFFVENVDAGSVTVLPQFEYDYPVHSTTCKAIQVPELTEKMAWFIGYFQGDGYVRVTPKSGELSVTLPNDAYGKKLLPLAISCFEKFEVNISVLDLTDIDNSHKVRVKSKQLATYFHQYVKQPRTVLSVPEYIKAGLPEIKAAYLQGLLDADGSIKTRPYQMVCTIYEDFAKEVQNLYYALGVSVRCRAISTANLKANWKPQYEVNLAGNYAIKQWLKHAPSFGAKVLTLRGSSRNSNSFPVQFFEGTQKPEGWYSKVASNQAVPVDTFRHFYPESKIVPIKVQSVQPHLELETYDIEVSDEHNFICEGVLVHNSATICIFSADDLDMRRAKTGDWSKEHPQRARANISVRLLREEVPERMFKRVFKALRDWGEPGFFFCNSIYEIPNPCVPGETRILTRDGYVQIKDVVDQKVEVWNGFEWSTVAPKVTGHDQKIVTVTLSDGSELTCTDYHKWHIQRGSTRDGNVEVLPAKDLKPGDKLIKVDMPVISVGKAVDPKIAYTQGVFAGDGCESQRKHVTLYGEKIGLQEHMHIRHALPLDVQRNRQCVDLHADVHESKFFVPHDWDLDARLAWLAGLIDTDGCLAYSDVTKTSASIQITSAEKGFLQEIRLMLTTLGIQAKVCDGNPERVALMPDGNGGKAEYSCRATYRLLISSMDVYALKELGIPLHRIDLAEVQKPKRDARRFVEVVSVEDAGVEGTVYCFTEPKRNLGTFEGIITGQCCEIVLYCKLEDGSTGFQACNLSTINGGRVTSPEHFYEYARAAAIIGTLQASFSDFDPDIFRPATRKLIEREALIGVSMTAILANPSVTLDEKVVRKAAQIVRETNQEVAKLIGINPAARTTCVKPEGTSTLQLGLTMSGIHPAHSQYYFRRVTAHKEDPVYKWFKQHNPHMCQESVWSANKTDDVITFPVRAPETALMRSEVKNVDHLQIVLNWQKWWVETGQGHTEYTDAHHNVSNTVTYDADKWKDVARFIWDNRQNFTGITLLRYESDKLWQQAVFEEVSTPEDRLHYVNLIKNFTPVDYTEMVEAQDDTAMQREWACAGGACQV